MDDDSENLRVQVGEVEIKDESTERKSNDPVEEDSDSENTPPLHGVGEEVGEDLSRLSSFHSGLSSRSRSTTVSDIDSSVTDNIKVVVRVRPLNPSEFARSDKNIIKFPGDAGAIWIDNSFGQVKPFTFNSVFEENTSQAEMFENCGIKHLINMALEGYSCTAFAFGQTGSGKTYTITGPTNQEYSNQDEMLPSSEMLGLIERSFQYMFDLMDKKADQGNYTLKASYLEVYNERVKDLLNPSSTYDSLPVRWSRDRGFYIENLFYVECDTLDDLTAVLEEGLKYRQVGSHNMNDHSSRSHSMLTVYIDTEVIDPSDGSGIPILRHGKLSFVDLAGSERVKETKSAGEAFTESQNINKSLLTLGNCISALSDAKKRAGHIPYRDSKLTKLLADSLGGNGITLMIACVSPSSYVASDTLNTLRYAHRAKKIRNKPVVQMDPKEKLIISLKREIKLLRTENNYFRQQLGLPSSDSQTAITAGETTDHNGNKTSINNSSKSSKEHPQALGKPNSLLFVKEDERNQLTTANLTAGANSGLYDMLQEYMIENEHLRSENGDLHKSHNEISRQRAIVSRENESLLKKLEDLEHSLRGLSEVEHAQSLPEGGMMFGPVSHRTTHLSQVFGTRSSSNPDEYQHKQRSSSEPGRFSVSLPPLHNGPYPNYVQKAASATSSHKGSYSLQNHSLAEQSSSCKAWSKSCPAKLKRQPLTAEKHCGGYAQMFAKNREKQSKGDHLTDTTALQSTSKPLKAFTTHAPNMNNTNYLAALHSHRTPTDESRHKPHAALHAPGVTQATDKLEQDIGNIDSQIQYYSSLNQRMQQYSSSHR